MGISRNFLTPDGSSSDGGSSASDWSSGRPNFEHDEWPRPQSNPLQSSCLPPWWSVVGTCNEIWGPVGTKPCDPTSSLSHRIRLRSYAPHNNPLLLPKNNPSCWSSVGCSGNTLGCATQIWYSDKWSPSISVGDYESLRRIFGVRLQSWNHFKCWIFHIKYPHIKGLFAGITQSQSGAE
jgi:hypothetical protein